MAVHTIGGLASRRIQVKPSPTSPGHVLLQVFGPDRDVLASITLDPHCVGVLAEALRLEAVAALPAFSGGVAA